MDVFHFSGPSGSATGVVELSKNSTAITVSWGPVPCVMRNSDVRGYRVRYKSLNNGTLHEEESVGMTFTATELDSYTDYSFEVAAINVEGLVGPYSMPVIVKTLQSECLHQRGKTVNCSVITPPSYLLPGLPPAISIMTDGGSPTDRSNFSMTCRVSVPAEAQGKLTVRWLGPRSSQIALNNITASDVGGATIALGLKFFPIYTKDAGWYTCDVIFQLYPQAAANSSTKVTVQSECIINNVSN